jgi:hypothetical protein
MADIVLDRLQRVWLTHRRSWQGRDGREGCAGLPTDLMSIYYVPTHLKVLLFAAAAAIAAALQLENVEEEEVFNARCAYCLLRAALAELTCSVTCSVLGRGGRSWPVVARRFLGKGQQESAWLHCFYDACQQDMPTMIPAKNESANSQMSHAPGTNMWRKCCLMSKTARQK